MKNKILVLLLCGVFSVSLFGCGKTQKETTEQERTIVITSGEFETEEISTEEITTEITTQEVTTESLNDDQLTSMLNSMMEERTYTGDSSIKVIDLVSKKEATIDSHSMQAASLIKLYIAGAVYEAIENNLITKSDNIDSLISVMIRQSDNDAANSLVTILGDSDVVLGMQRVNDYCQNHGFVDTHMGRLLLAPNDDDDNYTSVNDVTAFLMQVYEGKLSGSVDILSYMKAQERTAKLPAGIPSGVVTANKTGELTDVENDAMIVLAEDKPYVICVMTQYLSSAGEARTWITSLSTKVYDYIQKGPDPLFDAG